MGEKRGLDAQSRRAIERAGLDHEKIFEFLERYNSFETRKTYKSRILRFLRHISGRGILFGAITDDDVRQYTDNQATYLSNSNLSVIRNFYHFVTGYSIELRSCKQCTFSYHRALRQHEVEKMLEYTHNYRDRLLLKTLLETGLRVREVANLKKDDILEEEKQLFLSVIAKGNKHRKVEITLDLAILLLEFDSYKPTIFGISTRQIERIVKKIGEEALGRTVTPHMMRHAFATEMLSNGVRLGIVQQKLGHENIATTLRYIHNDQQNDEYQINLVI